MGESIIMSDTPKREKVADFLSRKAGILDTNDTVETAGEIMRSKGADALPVAENRRLVGVMNEPNPDLQASRYGHHPKETRVAETMKPEAHYCFEDQDCDVAREIMAQHHLDRLPVVDRDMRIVGTLERADLESAEG